MIETFEQHGADFWNLTGPYRTLHEINPVRIQWIEKFISLKGQRILDVGCGGGILSEALAAKGAAVKGIDLSNAVLNAARAHLAGCSLDIEYAQQSTSECVANGEQFDHVVCMEMLEHVRNPAAIIKDLKKLVKKDGYIFFSTINRTPQSLLGAIYAAEYIFKIVPKGTHLFDYFIQPAELVAYAENAGLKSIALSGLDYSPFTKSARLSQNLRINYFYVAQAI